MLWVFGRKKGLSDKRRGEIALALLKGVMVRDGLLLSAEEREELLNKARSMGLKTGKELVEFAKSHMIPKNPGDMPKMDGVTDEEMGLFLTGIACELLEMSLNSENGNG